MNAKEIVQNALLLKKCKVKRYGIESGVQEQSGGAALGEGKEDIHSV